MGISIQEHYAAKPTTDLYHYTSPKGCIGIVSTGELRATQIQFMNDYLEVKQAVELARNIIKDEFGSRGSDKLHEMLGFALDATDGAYTFVFSLSEKGDQLSQWRAYCPNGGVCLGFDSMGLLELLQSNPGFRLLRCVYKEEDQYSLIRSIVVDCFDRYDSMSSSDDDLQFMKKLVNRRFRSELLLIATSIKNESFIEEAEWRLIGGPFRCTDEKFGWRPGEDSIVPYFKFELGDQPPLVSARSGPARDPVMAGKAMSSFFHSQPWYSGDRVTLSRTKTSYRARGVGR